MFQSKYSLDSIREFLTRSTEIIILGHRADERSNYLINNLSSYKGICLYFELSDDCDKTNLRIVDNAEKTTKELNDLVLIRDLPDILNKLNINIKDILIDITGLNHVLLFFLTKVLLTEIPPRTLLAAYTEPINYLREDQNPQEYNLSSGLLHGESIPGFSKRDRELPKVLVPLLGFEGNRLVYLVDEILQSAPSVIIPIVGFPTYSPGWKSTALMANARVLNTYECYSVFHSCEASSPFKLISKLSELSHQYEGSELLIAPLGTRPHALGSAIYVSLNSSCRLVYDFPKERENRSEGIGRSNIYNLSSYIRGTF